MALSKVITKPIVSEKSMALKAQRNVYQFVVGLRCSKAAIKLDVERLFNVKVANVKTFIMPGKSKRLRKSRNMSVPKKWKKALVCLAEGQEIKFIGQND